jgi:hypothetical protein
LQVSIQLFWANERSFLVVQFCLVFARLFFFLNFYGRIILGRADYLNGFPHIIVINVARHSFFFSPVFLPQVKSCSLFLCRKFGIENLGVELLTKTELGSRRIQIGVDVVDDSRFVEMRRGLISLDRYFEMFVRHAESFEKSNQSQISEVRARMSSRLLFFKTDLRKTNNMLRHNSCSRITKIVFLQVNGSLAAHVAHEKVDSVMLGFPFLSNSARLLTERCRRAAFEKSSLMKWRFRQLENDILKSTRIIFYTCSFLKFGVSGRISSFIKLA